MCFVAVPRRCSLRLQCPSALPVEIRERERERVSRRSRRSPRSTLGLTSRLTSRLTSLLANIDGMYLERRRGEQNGRVSTKTMQNKLMFLSMQHDPSRCVVCQSVINSAVCVCAPLLYRVLISLCVF